MVQHREEEEGNVGILPSSVTSSFPCPQSSSRLLLRRQCRLLLLLELLVATAAAVVTHSTPLGTIENGGPTRRSHPHSRLPTVPPSFCWGGNPGASCSFVTAFRGGIEQTNDPHHPRRHHRPSRPPPSPPRVFLAVQSTEDTGQVSPAMDPPHPDHRHRPSTTSRGRRPPPPLHITIGPPCAGKTTWLRRRRQGDPHSPHSPSPDASASDRDDNLTPIVDVALDDQLGVYQPLHSHFFLWGGCPSTTTGDPCGTAPHGHNASRQQQQHQLTQRLFGRTVHDRIQSTDQAELCLVLQRLALQLSSNELVNALQDLPPPPLSNGGDPPESRPPQPTVESVHVDTIGSPTDHQGEGNRTRTSTTRGGSGSDGSDPTWRDRLHAAVEAVLEDVQHQDPNHTIHALRLQVSGHPPDVGSDAPLPPWMPSTVDLFVQEAIFRSAVPGGPTGLEAAQSKLSAALRSHNSSRPIRAVAWGNTNTRQREYRDALRLACEAGRPVRFVVHRPSDWPAELEPTSSSTTAEPLFDLDGDLDELLRRGVRRLLTTGRYVPAKVIEDMHRRTADLLRRALELRRAVTPAQPDSASNTNSLSKWELDRLLARLADFELREDRTVAPLARPPAFRGHRNGTQRNGTQAKLQESRHHSTTGPGGPPRPWDRGGPRRQPSTQLEPDPPRGRPPHRGGPWRPDGGPPPVPPPVRAILRRPGSASPRGVPQPGAAHRAPPSPTGGAPPPPKRPRAPGGSTGNSDNSGNSHRAGAT